MNGVSHDLWNDMKLLGEAVRECRERMSGFYDLFELDDGVYEALAAMNEAEESWWEQCDRYHDGDLEEKTRYSLWKKERGKEMAGGEGEA